MSAVLIKSHSAPNVKESLYIWHETIVELLRKNNSFDISTRQMAILMTVYLNQPPHTLKDISSSLSISKPSVCRAIDALSNIGMIKRKRDSEDRRVVNLQRTVKGSVYLTEFAEIINKVSTNKFRNL
ncbi:MAG: MarR family winged helix-turn-helix transcriptional regulator [Pseudomonadota bacterium]